MYGGKTLSPLYNKNWWDRQSIFLSTNPLPGGTITYNSKYMKTLTAKQAEAYIADHYKNVKDDAVMNTLYHKIPNCFGDTLRPDPSFYEGSGNEWDGRVCDRVCDGPE